MRRGPIRTCAGCGRTAPQAELLRFASVDGVLAPGRKLSGRGVYTCTRLACFDKARQRHGFERTLQSRPSIDPALARLYTEEPNG